ncbi:MAG TPA: PfkB family carbohydrate kinase [Planctomycetota bacterium]|nr:PfkB family carbohydrate kinase [Planctomycetota bacterium]
MSLLVVGSIALDTVETPAGKAETVLGGSAVYFTAAAGHYTRVRLVGVVGEDFPKDCRAFLGSLNADLEGLVVRPGKTFRWHGRYQGAMNEAETVKVDLNVFGEFEPKLPAAFRDSDYVFLANGAPELQMKVLDQVEGPRLTVADTMNLWIETRRPALDRLLGRVDALCLNETEARMLTGEAVLARAARKLVDFGLKAVVIKRGEHGVTVASKQGICALPAFPEVNVVDPTGAGDSFAGAMMGFLAETGRTDPATLLKAAAHGTAVASFTIQGFGPQHVAALSREKIDRRVAELRAVCAF